MNDTSTKIKAYSYLRYSTSAQGEAFGGDSVQRQKSLIKSFLDSHNAEIVKSFEDLGISSYRGKNAKNLRVGAFAQFLEMVRNGQIPKGSYLIVEGFDRISRQKGLQTAKIILDILSANIRIFTASDNHVYDINAENHLEQQMRISLISERAHDESKQKSQRGLAAYGSKMKRIKSESDKRLESGVYPALMARGPYWLKVNECKEYEFIPSRVEEVRKMVSLMSEKNVGAKRCAKLLNEAGAERAWTPDYILSIISSGLIAGHHSPRKTMYSDTAQVRYVRTGEIIPNVFPPILNDLEWNHLKNVLTERKAKGGKKQRLNENVFAGVVRCAHCGNTLRYQQSKKYSYLVCAGSEKGLCVYNSTLSFSYRKFSEAFFKASNHFDFNSLVNKKSESQLQHKKSELEKSRSELALKRKSYSTLEKQINNLLESDEGIPTAFTKKLVELEKAIAASEKAVVDFEYALLDEARESTQFLSVDSSYLEKLENDVELRISTNTHIAKFVESIYFRNGKVTDEKDGFYMTILFKNGTVLSFNNHFDKLKAAAPLLDEPIDIFEHGYTIESFVREKILDVQKQ